MARHAVFIVLACACFLFGCARSADTVYIASWQLQAQGNDEKVAVVLPQHLDKVFAAHGLPRDPPAYDLTATVDVPPALRGQVLTLAIPYLAAPVALDVDGTPAINLAPEPMTGYRSSLPHTFRIDANMSMRASMQLVLHVQNPWVQSAWVDTVPRLSLYGSKDPELRAVRATNGPIAVLAFTGLGQVAFIYLFVFLLDRRRSAYLWFAIQGATASYYHLFVHGETQQVFGRFDANLIGITIAAAPVASVYFTHALLSLGRPSRVWLVLLGIAVVPSLVIIDPHRHTHYIGFTVAMFAITVVYQVVVCVRLLRRPKPPLGTGIILLCWAILGATAWPDVTSWLGLGEFASGARGACVGLALFSALQSILISRQHIHSLTEADAFNAELKTRLVALEQQEAAVRSLNAELQRQIGDRSRQLFAALALIGGREGQQEAIAVGTVVQDRYRIVREVGVGGMGTVYEVARISDGRRLALKLARNLSGVELARLAREAQIASAIQHPNVVSIVDVDVAREGFLFLVLEYVDGPELGEFAEGFQNAEFACDLLMQVALGLSALHDKGIVHRDLKPANVLIATEGGRRVAKLADFGISRNLLDEILQEPPPSIPTVNAAVPAARKNEVTETAQAPLPTSPKPGALDYREAETRPVKSLQPMTPVSGGSPLTERGLVVGTPHYIAPELLQGPTALTPAADVFSFGVMAYSLFCGHRPFPEPPMAARMAGRPIPAPPPLSEERPDLPPRVSQVLMACLSLDPTDRPTAFEVAQALRAHSPLVLSMVDGAER